MYDNRNGRDGGSGYNRRSSGNNNDNRSGRNPYGNNDDNRGNYRDGNSHGGDRERNFNRHNEGGDRPKRRRIMVKKNPGERSDPAPVNKFRGRGGRPGGNGGGGNFRNRRPPMDDKRGSKKIKPHQKHSKSLQNHELEFKQETEIRLNRFLSNAGISSRREADKLIQQGVISLNDKVVKELGVRVKPGDVVKYNGEVIGQERKVYFLLNKPKDTITTIKDPEDRRTVMDIMDNACPERIFPVGRLDRNTTGLLMFTNDGELSQRLTHPSYAIKKIYVATLDKKLEEEDMKKLAMGVQLEDGIVAADNIAYYDTNGIEIVLEIHSGQNRVIHRMFESIGYSVEALDRIYYAGLDKRNLRRGKWRSLTIKEVNQLRTNCGMLPLKFLVK